MIIIGCDFHPSCQQIAKLDTETGRFEDRKLIHANGEADRFYRELGSSALVGSEAVGNDQWFVHLLQSSDMKCGSVMRHRFMPVMCGSRKRIDGMQNKFCNC